MLTNTGERNLNSRFGSEFQQFFFRKMDETLKREIADVVGFSLLHNEPRITLQEITVAYVAILAGLIEIRIAYVFNQTNARHNNIFPFYIKERNNLGSR